MSRCGGNQSPGDEVESHSMPIRLYAGAGKPAGGAGRNADELLDTEQAADYLKCSPRTLEGMRRDSGGPRFLRLFRRKGVRYRLNDLQMWANAREGGGDAL